VGRGTRRVVGSLVVVVALTLAGLPPAAAAPARWDPRIKSLAAATAKLRKLDFEHPVAVSFVSEKAFAKRVAVDEGDLTKTDKRDNAGLNAELRALGVAGPRADAFATGNSLSTTGVDAYYDPDDQRIYVSGKKLGVYGRSVVVHELTHALQDQHFDLDRLDARTHTSGERDALTALIEGDATRIETAYVDTLSDHDQDEYYDEAGPDVPADDAVDPDGALAASLDAPYALGPEMVLALAHAGGSRRVDRAFRRPPTTQLQFLDPMRAVRPSAVRPVRAPKPPEGATALFSKGTPRDFGAYDLYLMLATRIDAAPALDAADAWVGGDLSAYRQGQQSCFDVAFGRPSGVGATRLAGALRAWAAAMPPEAVRLTADSFGFHACDPGAAADDPPRSAADALDAAVNRADGFVQLLEAGAPVRIAECAATRFTRTPEFGRVMAADEPTDADQRAFDRRLDAIARECGDDPTVR
jgi:hypothetical protein